MFTEGSRMNGYDNKAMQAREGEDCENCGHIAEHWHHAVVRRMRRKPELNGMFQPGTPLQLVSSLVPLKRLRGQADSVPDELQAVRQG